MIKNNNSNILLTITFGLCSSNAFSLANLNNVFEMLLEALSPFLFQNTEPVGSFLCKLLWKIHLKVNVMADGKVEAKLEPESRLWQ